MRNEQGMALVIALVVALLLSLLCLTLTFSSLKEFQVSTEFENHEKALLIADAGYNAVKQDLRGKDINALLSAKRPVAASGVDPSNILPAWANRYPISPFEARKVDFSDLHGGGTSTLVSGLLTPAAGQTVGDCTAGNPCGRYFARLTDNNDADGDPEHDLDGTVFLRVVGIHRNLPGENASGSANSVAVIEAILHRDMSFNMTAPLSLISQQVNANFDGNSFTIDGYDHSGMTIRDLNGHKDKDLEPFSGISCLYDNPGLGDATAAVNNVLTAFKDNQEDNVTGRGTPAVNDDTLDVKSSGNPDSINVFDPAYLYNLTVTLGAVADYVYPTGNETSTKFTGGHHGTPDDPKITYVKGDLEISGNWTGAGILLVTGDLSGNGAFEFQGLMLVLGSGKVYFGGANKTILGGVVVANLVPGSPTTFGTASIDVRGQSNFYFAGDRIRLAASLLPMRTLSWREITPEIEPVAAP
ncbi:MAG TPA: hypothetical protein PLP42_18820 [Acidobacteriota bacterium]|nr:hypothetical protein [Acidobacteriota bacterium]